MSTMKTYSGSCHCGNVRFELTAEIKSAGVCNCSICSRTGAVMLSVPPAQFTLQAGEHAQTDYQFASRSMHHLFCTTCGVRAYGTYKMNGEDKIVVNLRCVDGLDLEALELQKFDGKSY
jgi:hypothetical protein